MHRSQVGVCVVLVGLILDWLVGGDLAGKGNVLVC